MNIKYKELYKAAISDKVSGIIVEYSPYNKTYCYRQFSHMTNDKALEDLYEIIINNTVFYAFSESEIVSSHDKLGLLDDLRAAAMYSFAERLPKRNNPDSDGTIGEILLDLLIQVYEPSSQKLIARAKHTEIGKKSEITGYDALYFTKHGEDITLWLGQAKAGSESYCKGDIKKDLNTKYSAEYFSNTIFYITTRSESDDLLNILNEINKLCFDAQKNKYSKDQKIAGLFEILKSHGVKVKIPCLLAYTKDIYSNQSLLKEEVEKCTKQICKYFDDENFSFKIPISYEIVFYVFPIKDVSYIRNKIVDLKKEVI